MVEASEDVRTVVIERHYMHEECQEKVSVTHITKYRLEGQTLVLHSVMISVAGPCRSGLLAGYAINNLVGFPNFDNDCQVVEKEILPWKYFPILFIAYFLSMCISSKSKSRYVLRWTDKAVLLVLWTCGDVELNPGPNENTSTNTRSQILRKFRRFTQTMLLDLMYKICNKKMPMNPYSKPPPGWDEYKPEVKFRNISNLRSGEDQVFSKMIWLLQNWSSVPLPSDWGVLLRHYNNLNEKFEEEESKKTLERWMLEKKLFPMLQEYSDDVDVPSVEIQNLCLVIMLKTTNKDQLLNVLDTKEDDDGCLKTHPNGYKRTADCEGANDEMFSLELYNNKERPESETEISTGASNPIQQYVANQSLEVQDRLQRKRRTDESKLAVGVKFLRREEENLMQSQGMSNGNIPFIVENHGGDTQNTTVDQCTLTCEENIDPSNLSYKNSFVESDRTRGDVSSSQDNLGQEILSLDTLLSNSLPGEDNHVDDTCDKLLPNSDMNPCFNNINILDDELNCDQAEVSLVNIVDTRIYAELTSQLYEPAILIMYLEKYKNDLRADQPPSRIDELCKDILNKKCGQNACNTDTSFFLK